VSARRGVRQRAGVVAAGSGRIAGPARSGERVRVAIRVKPGSARTLVGGRHGDALVVSVTARAIDGKATDAALRAVAEAFGVRRRDVMLVTGATSRDKVVEISGEAEDIAGRRGSLLGPPS
jgi:uncharacterized protein (TIGR00251 family)